MNPSHLDLAKAEADKAWALSEPHFGGADFFWIKHPQTFSVLREAWKDKKFILGWIRYRDQYLMEPHDEDPIVAEIIRFWANKPYAPNARMIECAARLIDWGIDSVEMYEAIPKLTPRQWKAHFSEIINHTSALKALMDPLSAEFLGSDFERANLNELLDQLSDLARSELENGGLQRPNATAGVRTFVARNLLEETLDMFKDPSYDLHATTLNCLFPELEPIDAGYVQSLARLLPKNQSILGQPTQ